MMNNDTPKNFPWKQESTKVLSLYNTRTDLCTLDLVYPMPAEFETRTKFLRLGLRSDDTGNKKWENRMPTVNISNLNKFLPCPFITVRRSKYFDCDKYFQQ